MAFILGTTMYSFSIALFVLARRLKLSSTVMAWLTLV